MMKLAIISHTEHYYNSDGQLVGWGSTINEINHLLSVFDEIFHCAPLYDDEAPKSSLPYTKTDRIKFVPLKPYGGDRVWDKLSVLTTAPYNIRNVNNTLKIVDYFQFRAPTGMGVYMIPYLKLFAQKPGWFKYAGNWMPDNAPLGYRIQKKYLTQFGGNKVTINGAWKNQHAQCLSFENPCLETSDLLRGKKALEEKDFSGKLNFVFVGRLEDAKGVHRILNSFKELQSERVGIVHLIGDGDKRHHYMKEAKKLDYKLVFHGFLPRSEIFDIMAQSHVFLLPSDSEGFPKVLAEAANFGCVPIVSNISCLADYVEDGKSGYLVQNEKGRHLQEAIESVLASDTSFLFNLALEGQKKSKLFTFDHYCSRIKNEII